MHSRWHWACVCGAAPFPPHPWSSAICNMGRMAHWQGTAAAAGGRGTRPREGTLTSPIFPQENQSREQELAPPAHQMNTSNSARA
ncbi:hypothetical protein F751_1585 [Auxenochlorella protothecoides]|uniref:Uncharacterized protein n=1 Tax=Auxenochlorella protothecoides TaxID=3075 RepID=A0A087SU05_AUXPR|nr:hypothetical protein F751_1585 [Auxenochlorella protothecoides]KFM29209.1 hypothetical protein F751_1585 [Auxenochlorella protothecoides]